MLVKYHLVIKKSLELPLCITKIGTTIVILVYVCLCTQWLLLLLLLVQFTLVHRGTLGNYTPKSYMFLVVDSNAYICIDYRCSPNTFLLLIPISWLINKHLILLLLICYTSECKQNDGCVSIACGTIQKWPFFSDIGSGYYKLSWFIYFFILNY